MSNINTKVVTVREAINVLLGVCDGANTLDNQGFNGYDAKFVRELIKYNKWSEKQEGCLLKLLKKYANQLSKHDINYNDIKCIEGKAMKNNNIQTIVNFELTSDSLNFLLKSSKQQKIDLQVTARWSKDLKVWVIQKTQENIELLIKNAKYLKDKNCNIAKEVKKELNNYYKKYIKQSNNINVDFSRYSKTPREYQKQGVINCLSKKKYILGYEMGAGKTFTAIMAAENINGKVLIVVPASLKINWKREIEQESKNSIMIINKVDDISKDSKYYIVSYDIVKKIKDLINDTFKIMILDEVHYIKSINNFGKPTAQRGKIIIELSKKFEYIWGLTGTLIMNRTKDIFNICSIISGEGKYKNTLNDWGKFAFRYCKPTRGDFGWDFNGSSNQEELNEKLKSIMLRVLKKDVLKDLPEKIRSFVPLNINLRAYNKLVNDYLKQSKAYQKNRAKQLILLNALRMNLAISKIDSTIEQVENCIENNQQVLIFTCYQEVINKIVEKFDCDFINGSLSSEKRMEVVDRYQKGLNKILVCNIKAAGVGLNLTNTQSIIFNDFDWLPNNHLQAEDRAHRTGLKNNVNIYYMFSEDTIDVDMVDMIDDKLKNSSKILDNEHNVIIDNMLERLKKGKK